MFYCDSCNSSMKTEDMYAISPRYDVPAGPTDVSRIYCRNCAQDSFFPKLGGNPQAIERSHEMAMEHLRRGGRI